MQRLSLLSWAAFVAAVCLSTSTTSHARIHSLADASVGDADRVVVVEAAFETATPTLHSLADGAFTSPAIVPHGLGRVLYVERGLVPGPGQFKLDLNTDTLHLGYAHPGLFGRRSWVEVYGRAQAFAANLLMDHAKAGVQQGPLGFGAGYALGGIFLARTIPLPQLDEGVPRWLPRHVHLFARLETRQWFHFALDHTHPLFVLPPGNVSVEPTFGFRLTQGEVVGRFRRLNGTRASGQVTAFWRPQQQSWGLPDDDGAFDGRQSDQEWSGRAELFIEGGTTFRFGDLATLAAGTEVFVGTGENLDDRNRFLVGGDNRYVLPLPGAGWGEFLADRVVRLHGDTALILFEHVQMELGADLVLLNDLLREGKLDNLSPVLGTYVDFSSHITTDWLVRLRLARAFGLPRQTLDESVKVYLGVEWRILPW